MNQTPLPGLIVPDPTETAKSTSHLLNVAVGLVLFGDYLALSFSRLLTGEQGNWTLFSALLVLSVIALGLRHVPPPRTLLRQGPVWCFLLLTAIMIFNPNTYSMMASPNRQYAIQKAFGLIFLCGPSLLAGLIIGKITWAAAFDRWRLALTIPLMVFAILAALTDPLLLTAEFLGDQPVLGGFFVLPNSQALAFALSKLVLGAIAVWHLRAPRASQRLDVISLPLLLGLGVLTGARTYAAALIIAFFAVALARGVRLRKLIGLASVILGVIFVFYAFTSDYLSLRYNSAELIASASYEDRAFAWIVAGHAILEHPIFGLGPGGFASAIGWVGRTYPHNLFLEFGCELGIPGVVVLLAFLAGPGIRAAKFLRSKRQPTPMQLFSLGLFCFSLIGTQAVGDWLRNSFLFLAAGMTWTSLAPITDGNKKTHGNQIPSKRTTTI